MRILLKIAVVVLPLVIAYPNPSLAGVRERQHKGAPSIADAKGKMQSIGDALHGDASFGMSQDRRFEDDAEKDFVFGYAAFKAGKLDEAEKLLSRADGKVPRIQDYVLYLRASIANHSGRFKEACPMLGELSSSYPDSALMPYVVLELARCEIGAGNTSSASARLTAYKRTAEGERLRAADMLLAEAMIRGGDARATQFVENLAIHAGGEAELLELKPLIALLKEKTGFDVGRWLENPTQQYELATSFAEYSRWSEVASRLLPLVAERKLSADLMVKAKWLLARSYRWTGRYDDAIALMEELRRTPAARALAPALPYTLATVYAKKDDYEKAISLRRDMLSGMSKRTRVAANIAYKIAYLYLDQGRYDEALSMWRDILTMNLSPKEKILARWYMAWCHYMSDRTDDALAALDSISEAEARKASLIDRVAYWKARMLEKKGGKSEAKAIYRDIIGDGPNGYYAVLARLRLDGDAAKSSNIFGAAKAGIYKCTCGVSKDGDAGGDVHLAKALIFDRLGLREEAAREIRAIDLKKLDYPDGSLLALASDNFAHDLALRLASSVYRGALKSAPTGTSQECFAWHQLFPKAYAPIVERMAGSSGVDPYLVWAIMKNESTFKPEVVSPAGAVGLMQLMPSTASKMLDGGGGFVSMGMLGDPYTNILLGTRYLAFLNGLFPDNAAAVIASYNAGEDAIMRWLKKHTDAKIEEWIEEIPYSETNAYVKKVLATYWNYRKLY
jgi:soluble lytic murein transglycosylase